MGGNFVPVFKNGDLTLSHVMNWLPTSTYPTSGLIPHMFNGTEVMVGRRPMYNSNVFFKMFLFYPSYYHSNNSPSFCIIFLVPETILTGKNA